VPEAYREALIAFYEAESPWMVQKLENLRRGDPLTAYDLEVLEEIVAERIAA
jgi:hypothetical protein